MKCGGHCTLTHSITTILLASTDSLTNTHYRNDDDNKHLQKTFSGKASHACRKVPSCTYLTTHQKTTAIDDCVHHIIRFVYREGQPAHTRWFLEYLYTPQRIGSSWPPNTTSGAIVWEELSNININTRCSLSWSIAHSRGHTKALIHCAPFATATLAANYFLSVGWSF